jgi:hypothetical protein
MGEKSVGSEDKEAVSIEDELAHDLQEAHVPKAPRGSLTRSKAPVIDLSDEDAEDQVLEQPNLRPGTKLGEVKRKRMESVDESDQETEYDNIVVDSKRLGKQTMKAPEEAGVKRGGKRGDRGGGRGKVDRKA